MAIKQAAKRPAPALQISLVNKYTETAVIPLKSKHDVTDTTDSDISKYRWALS